MQCDICGRDVSNLNEVEVEGTILNLCNECKKFGKPIKRPTRIIRLKRSSQKDGEEEPLEMIRSDFSSVLKSARQQKGLKQEEVAKRLNEKASLIHSIETGHHEPSLNLAKKLENFYGVRLIEKVDEKERGKKVPMKNRSSGLTLGDVVRFKKK